MQENMKYWTSENLEHYLIENKMNLGTPGNRWLRVAMDRWSKVFKDELDLYAAKAREDKFFALKG
jgi:hypothetical protein